MLLAAVLIGAFAHAWLEELHLDPDARGSGGPLQPLKRISNSVYFMCHSFLAGSSESRVPPLPLTPAAQILHTGFSFFVLIVISSYTANLVSFLVATREPAPKILSLEHAIQQGVRICGPAQLQDQLLVMYPSLAGLLVPRVINANGKPSLLEDIDNGVCKASIIGSYTFATLHSQHCDKILLDDMVMGFSLAWPVQQGWDILFSAATVSAVLGGEYKKLRLAAEQTWIPPSTCPEQADPVAASDSLQVADLTGIVFLYVLCIAGAVFVGAVTTAVNQKHVKKQLSRSLTRLGTSIREVSLPFWSQRPIPEVDPPSATVRVDSGVQKKELSLHLEEEQQQPNGVQS